MRNNKKWLIISCLILALSMFGLTGCGSNTGTDEPDNDIGITEQDYRAALFFANEEYAASGDESLERYMVYESEFSAMPGDAYFNVLNLLKTPPEEGYSTMITDKIKFNDVYLQGNTVYVDLEGNGLHGGSLEESYLIGQIVNTLLNSFDEVQQVQFLIDGEVPESLMGHIDAASPFTKDAFAE